MLERLSATTDPDSEAQLLAGMLAADLLHWPNHAWLVIDDYHHVVESASAEAFVGSLVAESPVQLLIASRRRPSWVSSRDILYGDVFELSRSALAMTESEIDCMLDARSIDLAPGLLALADGWPAILERSRVTETTSIDSDIGVPEDLFDYFADEVFRRLDEAVQGGLCRLAALPIIDAEVSGAILGQELSDRVLSVAVEAGILDRRAGTYILHPLAARFLESRVSGFRDRRVENARSAIEVYRARHEWDAAFELAEHCGLDDHMKEIICEASQILLDTGRLGTLESWLNTASQRNIDSREIKITEAELNVRHGRLVTAQTILEPYVTSPPESQAESFRVFHTAARAAHILCDEERALVYFRLAHDCAPSREQRRAALEGQLMCAAALEMPVAHELLEELRAHVDRGSPAELLRLADRVLSVGFRFGENRVAETRRIVELVPRAKDPVTRSSFLSMYCWGLLLDCDYVRADAAYRLFVDQATKYRVDIALPYAHFGHSLALAGLRRFKDAASALSAGINASGDDPTCLQNAYAAHVRLLLHEGLTAEAFVLEAPDVANALRWVRGEVLATRALSLASVGKYSEALAECERAAAASTGVETRMLCLATRCVVSTGTRGTDCLDIVEQLVTVAFETRGLDPVVTAYRGNRQLLRAILTHPRVSERGMHLVQRAGDESLAEAVGAPMRSLGDPLRLLSPREREVHRLLSQGLSNAAIARELYLVESTVKSHVQRIYRKLGTRSRAALVARSLLDHAASAAADSTDEPATRRS